MAGKSFRIRTTSFSTTVKNGQIRSVTSAIVVTVLTAILTMLLDWTSAAVYEKLDGSLAVLYYYKDEWWVSSSGMPDATGT